MLFDILIAYIINYTPEEAVKAALKENFPEDKMIKLIKEDNKIFISIHGENVKLDVNGDDLQYCSYHNLGSVIVLYLCKQFADYAMMSMFDHKGNKLGIVEGSPSDYNNDMLALEGALLFKLGRTEYCLPNWFTKGG